MPATNKNRCNYGKDRSNTEWLGLLSQVQAFSLVQKNSHKEFLFLMAVLV